MAKVVTFEVHGFEKRGISNGQAFGACPFCLKNKFYINEETCQWDCKSCGANGNVYTFLEQIVEAHHSDTGDDDWRWLERDRGLPRAAFKPWKLGWDGGCWLIPCYSQRQNVLDLRMYEPGRRRVISTAGCNTQLVGLQWLASAKADSEVWICEGEWDAIALRWIFRLAGRKDQIVVGVPGAATFKPHWVGYFRDMKIRLCYDNDHPGEKGATRAANRLQGTVSEMKAVRWPRTKSKGFDIRDFILARRKAGKKAGAIAKEIRKLLVEVEAQQLANGHASPGTVGHVISVGSLKRTPSFAETLRTFKRWIRVDREMEDALKVCYAVSFSVDIPGDPLWVYLVGPPGRGKTLLLMTMAGSSRCIFRSTVGPKSLVSGFRAENDPSELPKWNNRCAVLKDFTELMATNINARDEIYSTLRGAYDGHVSRPFGNNIVREYVDLHFSLLAGVTEAIHADNKAMLGERFMKFELTLKEGWSSDETIRAALHNIARENQMELELAEASGRFLAREVDTDALPAVPEWIEERVIALVQIVSKLRAVVERESWGEQRLKYRPKGEIGTRLAKQLVKIGMMLAFVDGVDRVEEEQYRIMERIAFDSAIGFHMEIVSKMIELGGECTRNELLGKIPGLPYTNLARSIDDLSALHVVEKVRVSERTAVGPGREATVWRLVRSIQDLWKRARVGAAEKHAKRALSVRRRRSRGKAKAQGKKKACTKKRKR